MAASDARPIPRKNTAARVYFPILDADGDLVSGAASLDSEVSLDGAAFADCTSEATEVGTTGIYYLDLTASEMNADAVVLQVKTATSGAKTTVIVMYPEESGDIRADVVMISGDASAADNLEAAADGTGYNLGGGAIVAASVTADPSGVTTLLGRLSAARAGYLDNLSAGAVALASALSSAASDLTTLLGRLTSTRAGYLDNISSAAPTAAAVADAVWDELLASHQTEGSAGHYLTDAGSAADPLMNTVPGSYAAGTAGNALGRIGSGQITTVSPVSTDGNITELIGGATYAASAGTSFDWTDTGETWPVLSSATVTVALAHPDGQTASYTGSVVTATGTGKKVRLELTAAQSAALQALNVGRWSMLVWATLSGGAVIPLVSGYANVVDRPGP